jgi:hypothetical protein
MTSTDKMSLEQQIELGVVTIRSWPVPLEQISREESLVLSIVTMSSWQELYLTKIHELWSDSLKGGYSEPVSAVVTKSWAEQVEDGDEIDWDNKLITSQLLEKIKSK